MEICLWICMNRSVYMNWIIENRVRVSAADNTFKMPVKIWKWFMMLHEPFFGLISATSQQSLFAGCLSKATTVMKNSICSKDSEKDDCDVCCVGGRLCSRVHCRLHRDILPPVHKDMPSDGLSMRRALQTRARILWRVNFTLFPGLVIISDCKDSSCYCCAFC